MLVDFEKLSDSQQDEFARGFNDSDDIGVDDWESSTPWGAPWFWASPEELEGEDAYEWGQSWFVKNRDEIEDLVESEKEDEDERED